MSHCTAGREGGEEGGREGETEFESLYCRGEEGGREGETEFESLYCRERERAESEERLQRELQKLRDQAKQELEHTISYTRDLYERENR